MRPVIGAASDFVRVWDENAETDDGARFDRWFGPLAEAILADDPAAAVLAYTWIDESATREGATRSLRSQLRTTVNGQRLAVALRHALAGSDHDLHMIGFSHGAKVATVATVLVEPQPRHLTLLDSPDSLVPALGGALNDLAPYLRLLAPDLAADESFVEQVSSDAARVSTFVDNYPSHFGESYSRKDGLGSVIDVRLDPEAFPLEYASSPHSYAWAWYLETARDTSRHVGYAWSPVRPDASGPKETGYRQIQNQPDPFELESDNTVRPVGDPLRLRSRLRKNAPRPRVLTSDRPSVYGYYWRRSGDVWASAPVSWISGPDDAVVRLFAYRTERARSVKGWSDSESRLIHIPLGAALPGPTLVAIKLESSAPAEVEVGRPVAVNGFNLPIGAEFGRWLRPLLATAVVGLLVGIVGALVAAMLGGRRRS